MLKHRLKSLEKTVISPKNDTIATALSFGDYDEAGRLRITLTRNGVKSFVTQEELEEFKKGYTGRLIEAIYKGSNNE